MKLFFHILLSITPFLAFGQIGMGEWQLNVSPSSTIDVAAGNGVIMAAFPEGILEYDLKTGEKTNWTSVNALSDINISSFMFDEVSKSFWIGYQNGNIDRITKNNKVVNIPWLKLTQIQGSKKINNFLFHNNFVYVSTDLGILKINTSTNDVLDTYYTNNNNLPTLETVISNDTIFALTHNQLFYADVNHIALANYTIWSVDPRIPVLSNGFSYKSMIQIHDKKFISYHDDSFGKDSVYRIHQNSLEMVIGDIYDMEISKIKNIDNRIFVILDGGLLVYDENVNFDISINNYSFSSEFKSNAATYHNERYWIGDDNHGLVYYQNQTINYPIQIIGTPKRSYFRIKGSEGRVAITGGTVASSAISYNHAGVYTYKDEKWTLLDQWNQNEWSNILAFDFGSVAIGKDKNEKIAVSSHSKAPLSIIENNQVTQVYNQYNSELDSSSLGNTYTMVTDLEYDDDGNLWMLNGFANNPLKVLTKDGGWYSFFTGQQVNNKFTGNIVVDYKGNKWFTVPNVGVVGFKDNKTIADPSDDVYRFISKNGSLTKNLPSNNVTTIAVDFDNEIWIGTEEGFAILYNSEGIFDSPQGQVQPQRIVIGYEENNEYVLGATHVTVIKIDGGNRKWIGTANSGLFLLSPDGTQVITSYTKENSKLISNNIIDMDFNHKTGELFIITDLGMVILRTDSSYEDPSYSVNIFPNPVEPNYNGMITMQGILFDSDVRITDVSGNLIYKTTSVGGTAVWNGKTVDGEKVKPGVYLIWTASNQYEGKKVGKITIIN